MLTAEEYLKYLIQPEMLSHLDDKAKEIVVSFISELKQPDTTLEKHTLMSDYMYHSDTFGTVISINLKGREIEDFIGLDANKLLLKYINLDGVPADEEVCQFILLNCPNLKESLETWLATFK